MFQFLKRKRETFQQRTVRWMKALWLDDYERIANNKKERQFRFLEEAFELVQACGMTREEVIEQLDWTYGRPLGLPQQEVGGVVITLMALGHAYSIDIMAEGEKELKRVHLLPVMKKIRAKHKLKPGGGGPPRGFETT